jgi:phosphatidylserine/phosphatidylglycerophosphate/cardiolipin synthase-like enzyme
MKWCLLVIPLLATAWAQPSAITTPQQVVSQLDRANVQLLVVAPSVFSKPTAEAIRRAAAERGVQVFVIVSPRWVEAPGSYVASLSLIEGVQVRLAETERRFVVVDVGEAAFVIEGGLVSEGSRRFDEGPTYALADPLEVASRAGLFTDVWQGAVPYTSFINREDIP